MRELADLGERTEDGLVAWRDFAAAVILARFLGLGIASMERVLFSLSPESIASLRLVRIGRLTELQNGTRLVLFVPRSLGRSVEAESSDTKMGLGALEGAPGCF